MDIIKTNFKVKFRYIKLSQVNLHEDVSEEVISSITPIGHAFRVPEVLTMEGIDIFLHSHPIRVLATSKNTYECFAGLRSFQIGKTYLGDNHKIPVLIHEEIDGFEVSDMAVLDVLVSHIVFGLDAKTWQLDFARILKKLNVQILKQFFPKAKNKSKFAELLKADRRTFLKNKKSITEVTSELKSLPDNEENKI